MVSRAIQILHETSNRGVKGDEDLKTFVQMSELFQTVAIVPFSVYTPTHAAIVKLSPFSKATSGLGEEAERESAVLS